jgi:hypothetical protein
MIVDKYELEKQRKEEILKGSFARVEIVMPLVTTNDKHISPIIEIQFRKTNIITKACLINTMDSLQKDLLEKNPEIGLAKFFIDTKIQDKGITNPGDVLEVED